MFDLPQIIKTNSEPAKSDLSSHYKNLFPEYNWKPHCDYLKIAKEFTWIYDDFLKSKNKRWLTVLGQSGSGKSEWGKRIVRDLVKKRHHAQRWDWSNVCAHFEKGNYDILHQLERMPFLVIDEIGKSSWKVGNDKLTHLIEQRLGKWTICISNRSSADIAENIDARITSRFYRDENRVLQLSKDCPDYGIYSKKN